MSDNYNEKQSVLDKEEVQRIIDERIARLVEEEKQLDSPSTGGTPSLPMAMRVTPWRRIRLARVSRQALYCRSPWVG